MSIIRTGILLGAAIMLLPADAQKQSELKDVAQTTVSQTMTFCERNPATCQTGNELWALFLHKAEFGMELASNVIRDQLSRRLSDPTVSTKAEPERVQPVFSAPVRLEPLKDPSPMRQTLSTTDRIPQWRGGLAQRGPY
ncbi:MAG: DUF5330 domain-containing protein [Hyphomicrobiaceae bacterium]